MTISILFVHDALKTLCKLADVCQAWCEKFSDDDESVISENTSLQENVLWTYLNGMDINVKQILGIIYLLCSKAVKPTSTLEEKELGLGSAKWYFSCLRVPGSAAYSVYHPNLYSLCIDCFYIPPESKDAWNEYESLLPLFVEALDVLVPLLSEFHFDRDSGTIEHTIKKLSELAASDVSKNDLNFSTDFVNMNKKERRRHYQIAFVITSLAYQGLTSLMQTDLNGEKDYNYSIILSHLNRLILCCKATSSPIPHKYLVIKDNTVAFICYNLNCDRDFYSKLSQAALKRLCIAVNDKTEFRSVVADSVFTILYNLNTEDIAEMIHWLLLLVDSSEIKDRVISLEILNLLLTNFKHISCDGLDEDLKIYLTPLPLVYAVLTRCDDTSPAVRTKALGVLSQSMEHVLKFIMETRDKTDFPEETFEDNPEREYTVNGYHRVFWYELNSFRERLDEIASILVRRIEDNNVTARRAALQALEKLITFDLTYLSVENIKLFLNAAMDSNVVVRKQMIQSLTAVLGNYYDNSLVQVYWIKCIFPLVNDPETGVQGKALGVMEEQFLQNIFSNDHTERDRAFSLLNHLSNGQLLSYKRYLQKAFNSWKSENKLRYQVVGQLEKHFGKDKDKCIWFYLSIFAAYSKLPSKICSYLEDIEKYENSENFPDFMDLILKVLGYAQNSLPEGKLRDIGDVFKRNLLQFVIPVELIPITIEVLHKIEKHLENQEEFSKFSSEITEMSVDCLSQFVFERHLKNTPSEELIAKHLCVVKEFCQISASYISDEIILILKTFISSNINGSSPVPQRITPILKAHAFATLGKILLQEEKLAKEILPMIAKELTTS
ncbi:Condensin-2 complex subunit D3, partial [Stegodyphus mimosarum]